jgi:hypothetical protein
VQRSSPYGRPSDGIFGEVFQLHDSFSSISCPVRRRIVVAHSPGCASSRLRFAAALRQPRDSPAHALGDLMRRRVSRARR